MNPTNADANSPCVAPTTWFSLGISVAFWPVFAAIAVAEERYHFEFVSNRAIGLPLVVSAALLVFAIPFFGRQPMPRKIFVASLAFTFFTLGYLGLVFIGDRYMGWGD